MSALLRRPSQKPASMASDIEVSGYSRTRWRQSTVPGKSSSRKSSTRLGPASRSRAAARGPAPESAPEGRPPRAVELEGWLTRASRSVVGAAEQQPDQEAHARGD